MANEEHLKILKQGVEVWNKWREDHPDVIPDLTGANLQEVNFLESDLEGTSLRDTNLKNANLEKVKSLLSERLAGADLTGTKLPTDIAKFDALETIAELSKNARKIFLGMLAGCFYSLLTIVTTTDVRLVTNSTSSPL